MFHAVSLTIYTDCLRNIVIPSKSECLGYIKLMFSQYPGIYEGIAFAFSIKNKKLAVYQGSVNKTAKLNSSVNLGRSLLCQSFN